MGNPRMLNHFIEQLFQIAVRDADIFVCGAVVDQQFAVDDDVSAGEYHSFVAVAEEGELRTRYEGSHSPFGFVWQIASATGWSVDYILDGVNYQTLILMLNDAPRYVRQKQGGGNDDSKPEHSAEDEANDIVGFFQSKLE